MSCPILVLVLLMLSGVARGECVATPCYAERIGIASCRPISEVLLASDVLERAAVDPERAAAILKAASGVVILGKLERSRPLPECGEPDKERFTKAPLLKEYLVLNSSCDDLPAGLPTEGFVTTPCCDELPVRSPECVLSLETLGPLPAWIKHERLSPENP